MRSSRENSGELAALGRRPEDWPWDECDVVGRCTGPDCGRFAPLREVPTTGKHACRPCWDAAMFAPRCGGRTRYQWHPVAWLAAVKKDMRAVACDGCDGWHLVPRGGAS